MTRLEQLTLLLDRITEFLCTAFGALLGLMILLICADIVLRNMGVASFPWMVEVTEYLLYGGTFLAAAWVLRMGGHVRVEILTSILSPGAARRLERLVDLLGLGVSLGMLYYGVLVASDAYRAGMIQFKTLIVPEWLLLLPIPIGCALLAVEFVLRLVRVRRAPPRPDAAVHQPSI